MSIIESEKVGIFLPEQILDHVKSVIQIYKENPRYALGYLKEFLNNTGYSESQDGPLLEAFAILKDLEQTASAEPNPADISLEKPKTEEFSRDGEISKALEKASREIIFRKEIEEFYLPKQLIDAIIENGGIPKSSMEAIVGIGFTDIADYTYLAKFLSPKENQIVLNGLYSAFHWVLKRHGGYLNKIEGDSLMFHYGGLIDPRVKDLTNEEATKYIARELFYTCVEMQRICVLFNQANDRFLYENADQSTKEAVKNAFTIISSLRNNLEVSSSINALFQIRIRIGANIGEVTIGNFGPEGAKQWDVIGIPVIDAKRMESTAPIGGLRVSEQFYKILESTGIAEEYYNRFKREAHALFGFYRSITREELFKFSVVRLKDKKNADFRTYSIQVNPGLPEDIMRQAELLLEKGEHGADRILELLQYYRGNRYVVDAVESMFKKKGVIVRRQELLQSIYPKKCKAITDKLGTDKKKADEYFERNYSLYRIFEKLGKYQDTIKVDPKLNRQKQAFADYDQYIKSESAYINYLFRTHHKTTVQKNYFFNVVYPLVFQSLRGSILEYQNRVESLEAY